MALDIEDSFVQNFESDMKLAYQRMSAQMLSTVRRKLNIPGKSTTFQKLGKGTAGTKSRHGQVPILNLAHDPITCTLADYYGGEYVDKLDELKIQHDERQGVAASIAGSLNRKSDELVITAAEGSANSTVTTGGVTQAKVEEIFEYFGDNDVPNDGMRYLFVSPQGWTDLMGISAFSSADYVSADLLPFKGQGLVAKMWFSFFIQQHSGLSSASSVRSSLAWHRTALGHASGAEVSMDVTWQGKEQAALIVGSMSQGACLIDSYGIYLLKHTEV